MWDFIMHQIYSPGTPEDLIDKKARLIVAQMTYPELVNFLLKYHTPEEVEEDLREIARRMCRKLFELWSPKSKTVKGAINDLIKFIWGGKLKYRIIEKDEKKRPLRANMIDKDCKLCKTHNLPIFHHEVKEVQFCAAISGFLEELLNLMAKKGTMVLKYKSVEVRTVASVGSGYSKCIHVCTFKY